MITAVADKVGHLYVMQRTPQYVVPLGNGPFRESDRDWIRKDPIAFRDWQLDTAAVFGFKEGTESALALPPDEVNRRWEEAWRQGNGFAFMLKHFSDIVTSPEANKTATDFVISKIRSIVKDPKVAEKLIPSDYYAKRPLATDNYYETFNRENVTLVDVREDPIEEIVEQGIRLKSGRVIECDVIAYATGFDGVTGNYLKIDTTGRGGVKLADRWKDGPRALIGLTISGFPNLFMIFGPFGPFTSQPLVHEWQVNWIADAIKATMASGNRSIEPEKEAEDEWVRACDDVARGTLFAVTDSWINGSNIAGKPKVNMFCMSGMASYMRDVNALTSAGYRGFRMAP